MHRRLHALSWFTAAMLAAQLARAGTSASYLRPRDTIFLLGDVIATAGSLVGMLQRSIDAAYPGAGIRVLPQGEAAKTAAAGVEILKRQLRGTRPTIVAVMFGVNDTGWRPGGEDEKTAHFAENLTGILDLCATEGLDAILLRSTPFAHNARTNIWITEVGRTLDALMTAQDNVAAQWGIPVIDVQGAYRADLQRAWQADPMYEFSPDAVHPRGPGNAAVCAELLRALGVGLPLAGPARGDVRQAAEQPLVLTIADRVGIARSTDRIPLRLTLRNGTDQPVQGNVRCIVGAWSDVLPVAQVPAGGEEQVPVFVPATALPGRTSCDAVYALFTGEKTSATGHTAFHFSRIVDLSKISYAADANSFRVVRGAADAIPPVTLATAQAFPDGIHIGFSWQDQDIVALAAADPRTPGRAPPSPSLNSRPGEQKGDTVEIFVDLRAESAAGRGTAALYANPQGVLRIAVYWRAVTDGKPVAQVAVYPPDAAGDVTLKSQPDGTHTVIVRRAPAGASFGFGLLLSDVDSATKTTTVFQIGGDYPMDPLGFVRMSASQSGVFYRVGY